MGGIRKWNSWSRGDYQRDRKDGLVVKTENSGHLGSIPRSPTDFLLPWASCWVSLCLSFCICSTQTVSNWSGSFQTESHDRTASTPAVTTQQNLHIFASHGLCRAEQQQGRRTGSQGSRRVALRWRWLLKWELHLKTTLICPPVTACLAPVPKPWSWRKERGKISLRKGPNTTVFFSLSPSSPPPLHWLQGQQLLEHKHSCKLLNHTALWWVGVCSLPASSNPPTDSKGPEQKAGSIFHI